MEYPFKLAVSVNPGLECGDHDEQGFTGGVAECRRVRAGDPGSNVFATGNVTPPTQTRKIVGKDKQQQSLNSHSWMGQGRKNVFPVPDGNDTFLSHSLSSSQAGSTHAQYLYAQTLHTALQSKSNPHKFQRIHTIPQPTLHFPIWHF